MISRTQQRLVTVALLSVAAVAFTLAVAYQGDRLPAEPRIVGAGTGSGSGDEVADAAGDEGATPSTSRVNPIEGFLPQSGEGSACREPVGVDLIDGYGATLTINGRRITADEMNVVLGEDGQPTREITASRSLGHYTFGPEPDCPNGSVVRATDNVMRVCVYRLLEGPDNCVVSEISFDAL